eukprot:TRINITY_DN32170_c0_g1_i1.p1 TRINITY_DN32170_c0_g1~~TRINITY_DN32170_c0_g1_i1.p1  ORF type:complete len:525 (-),score=143.11 TRINITY_DN32170_c0_g1_i1:40-1614(-)
MGGTSAERAPTVRSLRVLKLIAMLHENRERLLEVVSFLPQAAAEAFGENGSLEQACRQAFQLEVKEGRELHPEDASSVSAAHLAWGILPRLLANGGPAAVTALTFDRPAEKLQAAKWQPGLVVLFMAEAAGRGLEYLLEEDFLDLARLATVMCFLGNLQEQHAIVTAHAEVGTEQVLKVLQEGTHKLGEIVVFLPQRIRGVLLGKSFADRCLAEFDALDAGGSQVLELKVLLPVLVALGMKERLQVTLEQCGRFQGLISRSEGETAIKRSEMVSFAQFMLALAYLDTEPGQVAADNACIVLGERRVEDFLSLLEQDKAAAGKTELLLPPDASEYLASPSFVEQCSDRFRQLDSAGKGALEPPDLFQMLSELSGADPFAVSVEQCERFVALFGNCGTLTEEEFASLARHLCTMVFLHSERGRGHLSWALECMRLAPAGFSQSGPISSTIRPNSLQRPSANIDEAKMHSDGDRAGMADVTHLATDVQFYKGRSEELQDENELLKAKLQQMEMTMREVNSKLDEHSG